MNDDIFGADIDIDEIPDNPNYIPDDVYLARVTKSVMKPTNAKDKVGITISYQIIEGDYSSAFPINEWLQVPQIAKGEKPTVDDMRMLSKIKLRVISFGFGVDELKGLKPRDYIGREVKIKTVNRKDKQSDEMRPNIHSTMPATGSAEGMDVFGKPSEDI